MAVNFNLYRIVVRISLDCNLDILEEKNLHYYNNNIIYRI